MAATNVLIKEASGRIIDILSENQPFDGCTVSKQLYNNNDYNISIFSLAKSTQISAESYEYSKIWIMYGGTGTFFDTQGNALKINKDETLITPCSIPLGIKTDGGCVYIEIVLRKDTKMNSILKSGEIIKLSELLPYQDGKIVNMDLVSNSSLKYVLMSFDEGTGLSEHAAPGEALVFALDGEAVIKYEGKDYIIKKGDTFKFDKFGKHAITATKRFKMALMIVFE